MSSAGNDRVVFERPDWSKLAEDGITAVDMHFHTNHSDSYTHVASAIKLAESRRIGFAVTDHNLVSGVNEAMSIKTDALIIPGIEISASDGPHILAYFYDVAALNEYWERNIKDKVQRSPYLATRADTEFILNSLEGQECVVSAAHPLGYIGFNRGVQKCIEKGYLNESVIEMLDAYEVICSGMGHKGNLRSREAADGFRLGYTGGTDGHMLKELGNVVTCSRYGDIDGFLRSIIGKDNFVIGREKPMNMKFEMGAMAFTQYMRYIPSSLAIHYRQNAGRVRHYAKQRSRP